MDPSYLQLSRARHSEMLQEAAYKRHVKNVGVSAVRSRVLTGIGSFLVSIGQKLKAQPHQSEPATVSVPRVG